MRRSLGETQLDLRADVTSAHPQDRLHLFAVYGAFATIALIVFGTISFHPF